MSDFREGLVADVWGRRLEGHPLGEADCVLLADVCDHDPGLSGRLIADEGIDRLLRCRAAAADAAVAEAFVASVLTAIDAVGAGREPADGGRAPEDAATPDPAPQRPEPPPRIVRPSPVRRRHWVGRAWPALIAGVVLAAAVGILLLAWRRAAAPRPAAAKPGAERVRQVPAREDARPTSPGYVATPEVGNRPKPSMLEPRDDGAVVAPGAVAPAAPAPKPAPKPAPQPPPRGSSGRTVGPRGVVIAEQTVNGRFRGTITVDGETREFDTRAAFEAAKRELGQGR